MQNRIGVGYTNGNGNENVQQCQNCRMKTSCFQNAMLVIA